MAKKITVLLVDDHSLVRRGFRRVAEQIMVVGPNDRNEHIADRVTHPCRPQFQERFECRTLRWVQSQNQHRNQDREYRVGEKTQSFRRGLTDHLCLDSESQPTRNRVSHELCFY